MSVSVRLDDLRKGADRLLSALRALEKRKVVPNIRLVAMENTIGLSACADEVCVRISVPARGYGEFCVKLFGEALLSALAENDTEIIEIEPLSSASPHAPNLRLGKALRYANIDKEAHDAFKTLHATIQLPTPLIHAAAQTAAHFADPDPLPYKAALAGVFFEFSSAQTRIIATDEYVLAIETLKDFTTSLNNNLIIPAKVIKAFASAGVEGDVVKVTVRKLLSHEQTIELATKDVEVVGSAIDSRFVSYEHLFLEKRPNFAIIDRKSFLKACRAKRYVGAALRFKDGVLFMSAIEAGGKEAPTAFFQCKYNGPPLRIAFSLQKLLSILEKIQTKEFIIRMADPTRPALLEPIPQANNRELVFLIMPCLL